MLNFLKLIYMERLILVLLHLALALLSQRKCHTAWVEPISSQPSNASIGSIVPIHGCYWTGSITCAAKKSSMSALLTSERLMEGTVVQFNTLLQN